ncbi:AbiTii domain-containing protein [Pedobacter hiemivivus]|uniref:AbiTii domain-containing protein n=1 Tax=Pedobacter hiemivivus TaxID=2530454 RepID=A0A4R0NDW6_9SPHI|nr:hypothetical protein [Pedobacter hiemivivus]TCC98505.1 hypothetical protein EZ444_04270 [Pedobacter hiemivivus]
MKLISDIINELMDYEKAISGPLLKTKVLASRIGNNNLMAWVDGELSGYAEDAQLPDYRESKGDPQGNYVNGHMQYSNSSIPIAHLKEDVAKGLTKIVMRDSISSIENLIGKKGLKMSVNAQTKLYLEQTIQDLGNPYFQILNVHLQIPATFLTDILSNVRSKLLDFMLEIENEFGQETEIQELKSNTAVINNIMNNTINANGDGNVINTGNNANVSASINITKQNKEQLESILKENHVDQSDITELLTVIDEEQPTEMGFGKKVNVWMHKMLAKSLDGSWQVGIGAGGTLLAEAIKKYYGL